MYSSRKSKCHVWGFNGTIEGAHNHWNKQHNNMELSPEESFAIFTTEQKILHTEQKRILSLIWFLPRFIFRYILKLINIWTMIMQSFVVLFWLCLIENGIVNSLFNLWSSRPSFSFQRGRKTFKTLDLKIQTRESKSKNIGSFFFSREKLKYLLCV